MKSVLKVNPGSFKRCLSYLLNWLITVIGLFAAAPAFAQSYTVQASIDPACNPHNERFVVPAGQIAQGFTFDQFKAGIRCTTRTQIHDQAWGISSDDRRSGNVYYFNRNGNGSIYSLVNNQTTSLPLTQLALPPGTYYAHVDGGINANVRIHYRLVAAAAPVAVPAVFPTGTIWRFGRADGTVLAARIQLLPNGRIQGYSNPNEDHWGLEGAKVVFYNASNQAITRFLLSGRQGGGMVLSGPFLPNPAITHVLTEVAAVNPPAVSGVQVGSWIYVGIGDCPGNDIAGGSLGMLPNPQVCDSPHAGLAAVCWDNATPRVMSPPGCTVKSVRAENCTGGANPGRMYRCHTDVAGIAPPQETVVVSPGVSVGSMEANTDMMGYDIRSLDLPLADPAACQAECLQTQNCRAWTYVKPNTKQGGQPRCWLKNPVPGKVPDPCCVSGVVSRP